jgi:hypothetical protein
MATRGRNASDFYQIDCDTRDSFAKAALLFTGAAVVDAINKLLRKCRKSMRDIRTDCCTATPPRTRVEDKRLVF